MFHAHLSTERALPIQIILCLDVAPPSPFLVFDIRWPAVLTLKRHTGLYDSIIITCEFYKYFRT